MLKLPILNGEPSRRLPMPATYVIGKDGRILFAEAHADSRVRPEPSEAFSAMFSE